MEYPRIVYQTSRTYWEVSKGVFNVTASPDIKPKGEAGYYKLEPLCRLKGDLPPDAKF